MGYSPENNPYIPGDPYSYDLKWMVDKMKQWTDPLDSADRAKASEEAAAISAEAADLSAQAAADSASDAKDSKDAAKNYADHIADPVSGLVTDWLAGHITQPTTPAIDTSLSVAGAAADAKATGDAIDKVLEKIDGVTYGTSVTHNVTAVGNNLFDGYMIEGQRYIFTNNTNASCTLRLYKSDGTDILLSSSLAAGAQFAFTPADKYIKFGGWFNGTGTVSLQGGEGIDNIPSMKTAITDLDDSVSWLDHDNYSLSKYNIMRMLDIECLDVSRAPLGDYTVSRDGDHITVQGSSTQLAYLFIKVDFDTLAAGTYYLICPPGTIGSSVYGLFWADKNKVALGSSVYINNDLFGTLNIGADITDIQYMVIILADTNYTYDLSGYVWLAGSSTPASMLNQNGYQSKYRSRIGMNALINKTIVSFGDSQTEQNKWQPLVADALGIISLVKGYGGYPVAPADPGNPGFALSSDYILGSLETYLSSNYFDTVLVMGGTNDWAYDGVRNPGLNNILIGNNDDATNATFKGALKKIVKTILTNHPSKQVILMSPIGGQTRSTGVNLSEPLTNANGYTIGTFAVAVKEMADYLGVPFIDVNQCGITVFNSATYLTDGLHINSTTGAAKVANAVINGLINTQTFWA